MKTLHNQTDKAIGILEKVCEYSQISRDDLESHCRQGTLVLYRQLAAYLILINTNVTLCQAGKILGNRDHGTMIHSRQRIADYLAVNDQKVMKPYMEISQLIRTLNTSKQSSVTSK